MQTLKKTPSALTQKAFKYVLTFIVSWTLFKSYGTLLNWPRNTDRLIW